MNKKYLVYGFISVLAIALATAALVDYISNQASVEVSVDHPIKIEVQRLDDSNWFEHRTLKPVFGCEETGLNYRLENLANVNIGPVPFAVWLSNLNNDASCDDFTSVKLNGVESLSACVEDGYSVYFLGTTSLSETDEEGSVEEGSVMFTFACNVKPAVYRVESRVFHSGWDPNPNGCSNSEC